MAGTETEHNAVEPPESGGREFPRTSVRFWIAAMAFVAIVVSILIVVNGPSSGGGDEDLSASISLGDSQSSPAAGSDDVADISSPLGAPGTGESVLPRSEEGGSDSEAPVSPNATGAEREGDPPYFPLDSNVPRSTPTTTYSPIGPTGPRATTTTTFAAQQPDDGGQATSTPVPVEPPVSTTTTTLPEPPPVSTPTLPEPPPVSTTTTTLPEPPPVP